jgi:hypothetical protein
MSEVRFCRTKRLVVKRAGRNKTAHLSNAWHGSSDHTTGGDVYYSMANAVGYGYWPALE